MIRNALLAGAIFATTAAHSQSDTLLFNRAEGVVVAPITGARFAVIASKGGRPADCPPGAFWTTKELKVGAVIEECDSDTRYQIMDTENPSIWGLSPWPRPIDDDDAGPRVAD